MPYTIVTRGNEYCVAKESDGTIMGCHPTRSEAARQIAAIEASEAEQRVIDILEGKAESYKPTSGMVAEARRGLEWRREFNRGGTAVGVARARDIMNGKSLSASTVKRMYSFFSRHEVDKQGQGFSPGEEGYPSAGRIAWALWGGDPGFSWSRRIAENLSKAMADTFEVGDYVRWNSSGGTARGEIVRIVRDGSIDVPNSSFTITGTEEDPAALIEIYRQVEDDDWEGTGELVGHKLSTLTRWDA